MDEFRNSIFQKWKINKRGGPNKVRGVGKKLIRGGGAYLAPKSKGVLLWSLSLATLALQNLIRWSPFWWNFISVLKVMLFSLIFRYPKKIECSHVDWRAINIRGINPSLEFNSNSYHCGRKRLVSIWNWTRTFVHDSNSYHCGRKRLVSMFIIHH